MHMGRSFYFKYFKAVFFLLFLFLFFQSHLYSDINIGDTLEFQIGNWSITGNITDIDIHISIDGFILIEEIGTFSLTGLQISAPDYINNQEIIIVDSGTISLSNALFGNLYINSINGHLDSQRIYGSAVIFTENGNINLGFDVHSGQSFTFNIVSQELQFGEVLLNNLNGVITTDNIYANAFIDFNGFNAQMSIYADSGNNIYASMENASFTAQGIAFNNASLFIDNAGNVSGSSNVLIPAFGDYIDMDIHFDNNNFILSYALPVININDMQFQNIYGTFVNGQLTINGELYIPENNTVYGFADLKFDAYGNILESPVITVTNFISGDLVFNGQMQILDDGFLILSADFLYMGSSLTITNMKLGRDLSLEYADDINLEGLQIGDIIISGNASISVSPLSLIINGDIVHQDFNITINAFHMDKDGNIISIGSAYGEFDIQGYQLSASVEFENQSILNYVLILNTPAIEINEWTFQTAIIRLSSSDYAIVSAVLEFQGALLSVNNLSFDTDWNLLSMDNISLENIMIGDMVFNGSAYLQYQPRAFVFSGTMGYAPHGIMAIENFQIGSNGDILNMGQISTQVFLGDFDFYGSIEFEGTHISSFTFIVTADELTMGDLIIYNFYGAVSPNAFSGSAKLVFNENQYLDINILINDQGQFTGGITDGYMEIGSVSVYNINININREGIVFASASGMIPFLTDSEILFGFGVSSNGYLLLSASMTQLNTDNFILRDMNLVLDNEYITISGEIEFIEMGGVSAYIHNIIFSYNGDFVSADTFGIDNLMVNGFTVSGQAQIESQGIMISFGAIDLNNTGFDITNLYLSWNGDIISMDSFTVSNLSIGDFQFSGSALLVNYPESLTLSGAISLGSLGYVSITNLYMDGNWDIISVDQASASINIESVSISGDIAIFKDMLYISGSASLPFLNGPIAFMADIIKADEGSGLFNSGYDLIAGGVTIPEFQVGGYSIMNSSLEFDTMGIEGDGGLAIPQVASIMVRFKFGWDGTFHHTYIAGTGMNIPIGSTGFFLQGAGGGLYRYTDPEEWRVELYGMLGDVTQTIQGDVLLSISTLGVVSGIGGLYVRDISMGMASFEFNNPEQFFACQAWLGTDPNQGLDIYFATLQGAIGFQRNWNYNWTRGYGFINVGIYFLPTLSGRAFLSHNGGYPPSCFLPQDGLSAGVKVGVWRWTTVYGARVLWDPWALNVFSCSDFPDYTTSY